MIEARVLGPVEVSVDGKAAPAELLWRKNLALLVYLARSPRRGRSREHLLGVLWPDKPESSARHSLNEALRVIRHCLGEGEVDTQADQVRLAPTAVRLDTEVFDALTAAQDWRAAAALVSGVFLEGFAVPGVAAFEDWLTAERLAWSGRTVDALVRLAEAELGGGHVHEATVAARRALAIDPLSEAAGQTVIRALALDGDRTGALQEFAGLVTRIAAQLGAPPGAETTALADRVRREREWHAVRTREPAPSQRRAPLVGRASDLERIWSAWQRGRAAGTSAAAILAGDAGVGKTRLADEIAARARLEGACTAVIRAVESDLATPWGGILGLARGGLLGGAGIAATPPGGLAWFAERIPEWADRFPGTRGTAPEPSPGRALSDMLRAVLAEQPVTLVVDDAEWLDRDSLLALAAALRDLVQCPLFVVLATPLQATRPELDELQARLNRDVDGVVVRLAPLGAPDIRSLARWAVPGYGDAELDRLTRRVSTDSAGLPLLVVELLSAVALGLDVETVRPAWPAPFRTLDQTLPGDLPEGIVGAIRVGFRRLSPPAQRVLQAAAVLGNRVDVAWLARATALAPGVVTEALDELEWSRWLTADGRGYGFVARIVRQIVEQDLLTPGQRQRLLDAADHAG
jgi:DNA-binding SARP family transcriptional activator